MSIKVHNHVDKLINLSNESYTKYLDELIDKISVNEPQKWMIKGSINNASKPFVSDENRDRLFQRLLDFDLTKLAYETFQEVTNLFPLSVEEISCHIVPAIESKGGGACYAPGKILLAVRIDEYSPYRLKRNVAHEYSHTLRYLQKPLETAFGYGEAVPYSVRDFLVFEGLASVLPETLYPHPEFHPPEVSEENETNFWTNTDPNAVGMHAYIDYMTMKAYEIGSRIVRKYMSTHNISIIDAHHLSDEELYWKSGYPFLK
jgi:uncharacterized protein YjaZ